MYWDQDFLILLEVTSLYAINKTSIINNYPYLGAAYLNRTVMSYHYYCWALGYASDESIDPILTTVCDDVNIEIFYVVLKLTLIF